MENEIPKYAKVGIHLCVLVPVATCLVYNAGRKKWYNKLLVGLYGAAGLVEVACIAKDLIEAVEKTATCETCPYVPPLRLVQGRGAA